MESTKEQCAPSAGRAAQLRRIHEGKFPWAMPGASWRVSAPQRLSQAQHQAVQRQLAGSSELRAEQDSPQTDQLPWWTMESVPKLSRRGLLQMYGLTEECLRRLVDARRERKGRGESDTEDEESQSE